MGLMEVARIIYIHGWNGHIEGYIYLEMGLSWIACQQELFNTILSMSSPR